MSNEAPTSGLENEPSQVLLLSQKTIVSPRQNAEEADNEENLPEATPSSFPSSSTWRNSIESLKFDPELADLLENHLKFKIPLSDCCSSRCSSNSNNTLKPSPAWSFLLYTTLFYLPLMWSSLKPLFFPPSIADVGNFDSCFMVNQTSLNETESEGNINGALVPISFLNCIICNGERGYVPLQPALTQMTSFAFWNIAFRVVIAAAFGSWVFCRCYYERIISLRLLAFGVLVGKIPKRQIVADIFMCLASCIGISYQLAYVRTFAPPSLSFVNLGVCGSAYNNNHHDKLPLNLINQTIIAHFNTSTVDALYKVTSAESELFSFFSLLFPFLIGPIFAIYKHQDPLSLLDSSVSLNTFSPETRKSSSLFATKLANLFSSCHEKDAQDDGLLQLRYLSRYSLLGVAKLTCIRRGFWEFWFDALCASTPFPVNYLRRLVLSTSFWKKKTAHKKSPSVTADEKTSLLLVAVNNNNDGNEDEEEKEHDHQRIRDTAVAQSGMETTTTSINEADDTNQQQHQTKNPLFAFMDYELGHFSTEFYLATKEEYFSKEYQRDLWKSFLLQNLMSLLMLIGYLAAISPELTFEEAKRKWWST
jgi:hypothetical protein